MSDLVTSPMFKVMLVLFGAIVTIGIVISLRGDLEDIFRNFCNAHPEFCGQATDPDTKTAIASMDALICAINRVNNHDPNIVCEIEGFEGGGGSGSGGDILLPKGGETAGSIILEPKVSDNPIASVTGMASIGLQGTQSTEWNPITCDTGGNLFEKTLYSTIDEWDEGQATSQCKDECNDQAGKTAQCKSSGVISRSSGYDFALPVTSGTVRMLKCDCSYVYTKEGETTKFALGELPGNIRELDHRIG